MLTIAKLHKSFGGLTAVSDVSFEVGAGKVLGVMGVNGAGKSTLLNCISGIMSPVSGSVLLDKEELTGLPAHRIVRAGLARTFQTPRVFRRLTLEEHLLIVPERGRSSSEMLEQAANALALTGLDQYSNYYAGELSGGQQKLLEFARLLMVTPKVVLLDEPFAGVHPDLCLRYAENIERIAAAGAAVVLVSHDPGMLYRLSDDIIVMNQGAIISRGSPAKIQSDPVVIEAYLGAAA
ncbi:MAG: ATP-binding cassette domain-containing protein [Rhizobiaceae bacterium]|nr:ATP-binding cassette domain-containing protein [Rhizobiaceae bacterium]